MAKSMLGKARTVAQKAATKKWQAAGAAAKRKKSSLMKGHFTQRGTSAANLDYNIKKFSKLRMKKIKDEAKAASRRRK
jgi:hypothetical protein